MLQDDKSLFDDLESAGIDSYKNRVRTLSEFLNVDSGMCHSHYAFKIIEYDPHLNFDLYFVDTKVKSNFSNSYMVDLKGNNGDFIVEKGELVCKDKFSDYFNLARDFLFSTHMDLINSRSDILSQKQLKKFYTQFNIKNYF